MSDVTVTTEAPLPNDAAARSPTGEILDASTVPPTKAEAAATETKLVAESSQTSQTSSQPTTSNAQPTADAKKPDTAPTAPAAYADFTLPEGLTLSKETLEAATPIFRELGLSQEAAQKLVSFHADQLKAATTAAQTASYESMRKDWSAKTLADKDISAYSANGKSGIDAVKLDIGRALGTLDPALATEFRAAMDLTGAGDHPAFVKAIWRMSQLITEGRAVTGNGPSPEGQRAPGARPPTPAQALYPNLPSAAG